MRRILLSFGVGGVTSINLCKELGEIPHYFSKYCGYQAIIDDYIGNKYQTNFRDVILRKYTSRGVIKEINKILYVLNSAKDTEILYLIHGSVNSLIRALAYKLGGGRKIYLKFDMGPTTAKMIDNWKTWPKIQKITHLCFLPFVNVYSVEGEEAYNIIKESHFGKLIKNKLYHLPNGFDEELLEEENISLIPTDQKEKIILTVGRIGAYVKNTEMFLDIFTKVDLLDWKVYLVGPVETGFERTIQTFYENNPTLRDKVIFTGQYNKKDLYDLYNRSRLFLLTSRSEGFAFVLTEAAYFKNYIISTDVGGANDMINITGGKIIEPTSEEFAKFIKIILSMSDDELNNLTSKYNQNQLSWKYILDNNEGIQKLIDSEGKISRYKLVLLTLFKPISIIMLTLLTITAYNITPYFHR